MCGVLRRIRDQIPRPGLSLFRCVFPCGFRSPCGWVSRVRSCLCPCGPHARPVPALPCRVFAFFSAVVPRFPMRLGAVGPSLLVPLWAPCATGSRAPLPCVCVLFRRGSLVPLRPFRGVAVRAMAVKRPMRARPPRFRSVWPQLQTRELLRSSATARAPGKLR